MPHPFKASVAFLLLAYLDVCSDARRKNADHAKRFFSEEMVIGENGRNMEGDEGT